MNWQFWWENIAIWTLTDFINIRVGGDPISDTFSFETYSFFIGVGLQTEPTGKVCELFKFDQPSPSYRMPPWLPLYTTIFMPCFYNINRCTPFYWSVWYGPVQSHSQPKDRASVLHCHWRPDLHFINSLLAEPNSFYPLPLYYTITMYPTVSIWILWWVCRTGVELVQTVIYGVCAEVQR